MCMYACAFTHTMTPQVYFMPKYAKHMDKQTYSTWLLAQKAYTYTHKQMNKRTNIQATTKTHNHTIKQTQTKTHVYIEEYIHACMHARMHACPHTDMRTYMPTYAHDMHTYKPAIQ